MVATGKSGKIRNDVPYLGLWQDCAISVEGDGPLPMGDRKIGISSVNEEGSYTSSTLNKKNND